MTKLLRLVFILMLFLSINAFAGGNSPKREFRGAWIATVTNIDWPSAPGIDPQIQRHELINILDRLKEAGVTAVIFQIRTECDALYASTLEPWSRWLTGQQGQAPSPFYDPLAFAIAEAHRRGMELHAWFNPYRAERTAGSYPLAPSHVSVKHPEWMLTIGSYKFLNPGLPMVREYVTNVIMDVVRRYDVDGVHMDDYFYPYPPGQISNQDNATFMNYSRGFTDLGDWRRDNINLFIKMVHDSIQVAKPYVKFGMSPFGIRKNSDAGTRGLDAYSTIYCDAVAWLNAKTIDYLVPQVYWAFARPEAPYGTLVPWWASVMNGRHLYIGHGAHNMVSASAFPNGNWPASELANQVRFNRNQPHVAGSVFFSTKYIRDNTKNFADSLQKNLYRYPALPPVMSWKDTIPPQVPQNLRYARVAGTGTAELRWDAPLPAADGTTASRFVVYRSEQAGINREDPSQIISLTGSMNLMPKIPAANGNSYYAVTALDRNANESALSSVLMVSPPAAPLLAFPANGAFDQADSITLRWLYPPVAASYQIQISPDSTFATQLLLNETGVVDTFKVIAGLEGQKTYYWRVKAANAAGVSAFSAASHFTTGFPATPVLAFPANNTPNIPVNVTFRWNGARSAQTYQLQVSRSLNFEAAAIAAEVMEIADTVYAVSGLEGNRFYFWRVKAANTIGASNWSAIWRFKTLDLTGVDETPRVPATFALYQNYPNPFNPLTRIVFDLPKPGTPQLVVYDGLGQEVLVLLDEPKPAGRHEVNFYAQDLPSGIYYYRLKFEGQVLTRRMTILK